MSDTATSTKTAKPAVKDAKDNALELGIKVFYDITKDGKSSGHITGIEYQRNRVVITPADGSKKVVRPAGKVAVEKNRSGKVQRVERAVRAARKATASASA